MKEVWKFAVPFRGPDVFTIDMPGDAEPLSVQIQHGEPQIWALVSTDALPMPRTFRIAGTGHPIGETVRRHVGTYQMAGGSLVFHVFEVER